MCEDKYHEGHYGDRKPKKPVHYDDKKPLIAPPTFCTSSLQKFSSQPASQKRRKEGKKKNSQERIVPPHAPQLIIAHHLVPRDAQRIRDLALLLNREQYIALHAKDERWRVRKRAESCCELG